MSQFRIERPQLMGGNVELIFERSEDSTIMPLIVKSRRMNQDEPFTYVTMTHQERAELAAFLAAKP